MSDRQKLLYAILASVFVHLAIGFVLASWTVLHSSDAEGPEPDLSQLIVSIMPPKQAAPAIGAAPTPVPATMTPVLDSDGLTASSKAPAHPLFQSDSNMAAGSLLPATGNVPLPSQAGPKRNFMDFANVPASIGKGETPSQPTRPRQAAQSAPSAPGQMPAAITRAQPSPTAAPVSTPKPVPSAAPDDLALGKPTPPPAPTPVAELARLTVPLRGSVEMAPMPKAPEAPPAPRVAEPSTQRETEKTRIDGSITEAGPEGVDAVETPYGRYRHKLSNLIGSRWHLYIQEHPKDVGDVTILVQLNTSGKVAATRVIANHAIDDLADLSTRAIMESDLPPVPDDLAPMLRNGKLEITFNFSLYDPGNDSPGR
jgi:hypothetical protein